MEHIRITRDRGSEVRVCRLLPFIMQRRAVNALQSHVRHATGRDIEPCRQRDDVEFMLLPIGRLDALLCEFGNGIARLAADIHNRYVIGVQDLVEILLETRPFHAKWVRRLCGAQYLALLRILDPGHLLLAPEVVHAPIGFEVEQVVLVRAEPEAETGFLPQGFVQGLALLGRVFECVTLLELVGEAGKV